MTYRNPSAGSGMKTVPYRMYALIIILLVTIQLAGAVLPDGAAQVQIIDGQILPGQSVWYTLPGMRGGETISVYAEGTSGDLDPFAAITPVQYNTTVMRTQFRAGVNHSIAVGQDPLRVIPEMSDQYFAAWNDDGGEGYAASFSYRIPADGTYHVVILGSPASQTSGTYRLVLGLNSPVPLTGDETPAGNPVAFYDAAGSGAGYAVQELYGTLGPGHTSDFHALLPIKGGDRLSACIESLDGSTAPAVVLQDFGYKRLSAGVPAGTASSTTLDYEFDEISRNNHLHISMYPPGGGNRTVPYRLLLGLNAPGVLSGNAMVTDQQVVRQPIPVMTGIGLDQLTSIDQKNENFGVVATIWMQWNDPELAFSPDTCDCSYKIYRSVDDFARNEGDLWPEFTLFNQQERRWTQNQIIYIQPDGTATYFERFWVTLQAPDFNFRKFPFDSQLFTIRLDCLYPSDMYVFVPWPEKTSIGNQLGEEEWYITGSQTNISTTEYMRQNSRYSFIFTMERHLMFYFLRIILPIVIIIVLSWIPFLLHDYSKRADIASANLLLFIAFNFTIANDLPRLGYLTVMDSLLVTMFIVSGATVIYNLYMKWLATERAKEYAERIDRFMAWFYPFAYIIAVPLILFVFGKS